jgi:hypothetical protein
VPQIVATLSRAPSKATLSFYLLPALIAIVDNTNPVAVSPELRDSFTEATAQLGAIAAFALPSTVDHHMKTAMQAEVLVSQDAHQQARELLEANG